MTNVDAFDESGSSVLEPPEMLFFLYTFLCIVLVSARIKFIFFLVVSVFQMQHATIQQHTHHLCCPERLLGQMLWTVMDFELNEDFRGQPID